jgi:hypothetical protein
VRVRRLLSVPLGDSSLMAATSGMRADAHTDSRAFFDSRTSPVVISPLPSRGKKSDSRGLSTGISIGAGLGLLAGVIVGGSFALAITLSIGIAIGMVLGFAYDAVHRAS